MDSDSDGIFDTGLLPHIRQGGGGGAASPYQGGHMRHDNDVTTLAGRAAAYLRTGATAFGGWARDCHSRALCGAH